MQRWACLMGNQPASERQEEGFTLAEVLVAVAILFFSVTAILSLMMTNLTMGASATARAAMVNAGNSYIEQLRSMPFDELTSTSLEATTVVSGGYQVVITPTVSWVDDPKITGTNDYKKISLSVAGSSNGRPSLTSQMEAVIRQDDGISAPKPKITFGTGSPADRAVVFGTQVYVAADAVAVADEPATISAMNFYVDGVPMHSTGDVAQWSTTNRHEFKSFNWDTTLLDDDAVKRSPDGLRTIKIEAWDSNQRSDFRTRQVLVDNDAPNPVTALLGEVGSGLVAKLKWTKTTDGTLDTHSYRFSIRQQPLLDTSSADTSGWTRLTSDGFTVPAPLGDEGTASFTMSPLSRYQFRIRARSPRGLEGSSPDATVVLVSRPNMSGSYSNVKDSGKYSGTVKLTVDGPTFNSVSSATLRRSANPDMSGSTALPLTWNVGSRQWTYTDSLPQASGGSPQYYYQATVTVTPSDYQGGTALTLGTQVLGPNHGTNTAGTMPVVRW